MFNRAFGIVLAAAVFSLAHPAAGQCPPGTPGNFTATDGTYCDHINLDWSGVSGASWYEVWRSTGTNYALSTLRHTGTPSSFSDYDVVPGVHYYYWITAWHAACLPLSNRSDPSAHNQGTAGGNVLPTPTNLTATSYCDGIELDWSGVLGALSYQVFRDDADGIFPTTPIGSPLNTFFHDYTPLPGHTYTYWVRAVAVCAIGPPPARRRRDLTRRPMRRRD